MIGKVYLVGAGPGDPELITLRGQRALARADVVLYDHLANPVLLQHAPTATRVYVGKKRSEHACTQPEIIDLLVKYAVQGKTVVRLKGGDPFIFGRGGEEVEALAEKGVPFEVIPGVTAPLGIAAYTGVPLTHRSHASVVTFVTGHEMASIDWSRIGLSETLVIFMGLHHLDQIVGNLISAGRPADTPAMAVRWGTRPDQQTVAGTLEKLPMLVASAGMAPPATIIVGEVVRLREKINWFERLPLFGKQIVITRGEEQGRDFARQLRELGADAVQLPVIEVAPLNDYSALDASIGELEQYDWLIFTSANAVEYFLARLRISGRDARSIRGRICAIGPKTDALLASFWLTADLIPSETTSEGVAAAFGSFDIRGARVLVPRAATAREVIPAALQAMGAQVDVVDAYRNVVPTDAEERVRAYLARGRKPHWITFTSGSTVKNFLAITGLEALSGVRVVSIGPATSDVARMHGLEVHAEANPSTVEGMVEAIVKVL